MNHHDTLPIRIEAILTTIHPHWTPSEWYQNGGRTDKALKMRSPDTSTWLISLDLICATKTWWATNVMVIVVVGVERHGVVNRSEV